MQQAITTPSSGANSRYLSGPLPSVSSSPSAAASPRMFQSPSIREVQEAVGDLREASLCVVEAVQAWRRERQKKELNQRERGDDGYSSSSTTKPQQPAVVFPWGASGDREASPPNGPPTGPENSSASNDAETTAQVRFPIVTTAQPASTRDDEDLPTFWWFPPETSRPGNTGSGSTQASRRTSLDPEMSVPEQVGRDLNEESAAAPAAAATPKKGHRHSSDAATGRSSAPPALAVAGNVTGDPSSGGRASSSPYSPARAAALGVNYLARMAADTDFVGAPGSVLVDFFPPDTKLYRNPFVLGHNLDDTLAVFSGGGGGGAASPRGRRRQDVVETTGGVSSPATAAAVLTKKSSRLDTRRVGLASAAVVAEDARERSRKRRRAEESEREGDQQAPPGGAAAGEEGGGEVPGRGVADGEGCEGGPFSGRHGHDGERFDRLDSGGSRSADSDHHGGGGSSNGGSKKRRGKGGIRFQDQQSEGQGRRWC